MFHQKHTQMPAPENTEKNVVGQPFFPYFLLKGQAWFFFIFGALVLLATFAQINPVWEYGPYTPLAISSGTQPDFYLGLLDGALRIMPPWEINFLGHTLSLSVLLPALLPLGLILGGAALWPFFEQWATGDRSFHNINDRPRNAPIRTATGVAAVVFYGVLWGESANDIIADQFKIPLYTLTWIARVMVIVGPGGGIHRHPADLHRAAAPGRRGAHPRGRDRHHPSAAERRVRRGAPAADRGGAGAAGGQAVRGASAGARVRVRVRVRRQRRAVAADVRPHRARPGDRQPRLRRDRPAAVQRARAWARQRVWSRRRAGARRARCGGGGPGRTRATADG